MSQAPVPPERLHFKCPACGLTLSLERRLAGVTAPCPACGSSITAPSHPATPAELPATTRGDRIRKSSSSRSKGHVVADSAIDYQHLDRKETAKALRIFLLFVLTICACLLVTWFMKDWIRR